MNNTQKSGQEQEGGWLLLVLLGIVITITYGPFIFFEGAVHGGGMSEVEAGEAVNRFYAGPSYNPPPNGYEWRACGTSRGIGPCLRKK